MHRQYNPSGNILKEVFPSGTVSIYQYDRDRGKWVWDDEEKNCQLQEILGTEYKERLLRLIFPIWDYCRKKKSIGKGLFDRYRIIQVYYYRMHPEEIEYEE